MAERICIEVDHRMEEHLRAERLLFADTRWRHPARIGAVVLLVVATLEGVRNGLHGWSVLALLVGGLFVVFPFAWKDARTWVGYRLGLGRRPPTQMEFDESGVHVRSAAFGSDLRWSMYTGLLEDAELLVLTYGGQGCTVLPKRCFASPAQLDAFRALAARHVGQPLTVPGAG